jgi:predicted esterase
MLVGGLALGVLAYSRKHDEASAQTRLAPAPVASAAALPAISPIREGSASREPTGYWLKVGEDDHPVVVFTPALDPVDSKPVIVLLHGMCDAPENECPPIRAGVTHTGFLVCPRANGACRNGGAMWRGSPQAKRALVDESLAALATDYPGAAQTDHDVTLVGFSQGAYLALDMVNREKGPWSSLVLIAASLEPDGHALAKAGIRRVLLAAGDYDGARPTMQRAAERLAADGFDARYESLGPVGHQFALDMNRWMTDALAWVRASPSTAPRASAP